MLPTAIKKKSWIRQQLKEMVLFPDSMCASIWGTVMDVRNMSIKERWLSRKHMGV